MSQSTITSVCLFVLRLNVPVNNHVSFSHVETATPLPGYYQYFRGVKCLLKDKVGTKSWQLLR